MQNNQHRQKVNIAYAYIKFMKTTFQHPKSLRSARAGAYQRNGVTSMHGADMSQISRLCSLIVCFFVFSGAVSAEEVQNKNTELALNLVSVPGGTFTMGNPNDESGRSAPHSVTVPPFRIMAAEVTQGLYTRVLKRRPSYFHGNPDHPVERVSWKHAVIFCNRLSTMMGRDSCYLLKDGFYEVDLSKNGFRLPTEAEWEYARREAGKISVNEITNLRGWYADNAQLQTRKTASLSANALGLYDLQGNVWEWCSDWYAPFTGDSRNDPTGPDNGSSKVVRGGCWWSLPQELTPGHRSYTKPDYRFKFLGFRCVTRN